MNLDAELPSAISLARPAVARILYRYPADVDDVLQDAAVRAWLRVEGFREECKFSTWYVRIAINEALVYVRRTKAQKRETLLEAGPLEQVMVMADRAPGPEDLAREAELERILREEIAKLPLAQRLEARMLLAGDRREYCEQARKSNRFRLRERLRRALARKGIACET